MGAPLQYNCTSRPPLNAIAQNAKNRIETGLKNNVMLANII